MIDTVLPQLNPSDMRLSDVHIPCLIDQFLSLRHRSSLLQISSLELNGCPSISFPLTLWLSSQSKLNVLKIHDKGVEQSRLISADYFILRGFLFVNGLPRSVNKIYFDMSSGFVLHDQLKSSITSQINDACLQLNTVNDLQLLLSKGLLINVSTLHIHLKQKRHECKL
jgi:hypothetical protein